MFYKKKEIVKEFSLIFKTHLHKISEEMLYGRFPKTDNFSFVKVFSSTFNTSSLIILIFEPKLSLSKLTKLSSFSITINFFGFF